MEVTAISGEGCQKKRKSYAEINIGTMGVKVEIPPTKYLQNNSIKHEHILTDTKKDFDTEAYIKSIGSPDSMDSGINMDTCIIKNNSLLPENMQKSINSLSSYDSTSTTEDKFQPVISPLNSSDHLDSNPFLKEEKYVEQTSTDQTQLQNHNLLPDGWEMHADENGPYYWHIKTGTIQRQIPTSSPQPVELKLPDLDTFSNKTVHEELNKGPINNNNNKIQENMDFSKYRSISFHNYAAQGPNTSSSNTPLIFHVKSLGWCEIQECDLTPEKSSKAVNKCIMDLSYGRNCIETIGKWGEGQSLLLEIDWRDLKLKNRAGILITTQPIHSIKVWGVGKENGKDFAYVVKDDPNPSSGGGGGSLKYVCYVFRCESSAYSIAGTLKTVCKRLMIERSNQLFMNKSTSCHEMTGSSRQQLMQEGVGGDVSPPRRPRDLSLFNPGVRAGEISPIDVDFLMDSSRCFPTPIEEPYRILKALYIGEIKVSKPSGIETLNEAIDTLSTKLPQASWIPVSVKVSPSCITILKLHHDESCVGEGGSVGCEEIIATCRVRYLSFLGIGRDITTCGFIMSAPPSEGGPEIFLCQVLHCSPTAAALCKIIEAACRLRYQKCLDSARNRTSIAALTPTPAATPEHETLLTTPSVKIVTTALKSMWNNIIWKHQSFTP